jgi:hypothetical protein
MRKETLIEQRMVYVIKCERMLVRLWVGVEWDVVGRSDKRGIEGEWM